MRPLALALLLSGVVAQSAPTFDLIAQSPAAPEFDVISIRRNVTRTGTGGGVQGARYVANNMTTIGLIMGGYQIGAERVDGAPEWTMVEGYDIVAQAANDIAPGQLPAMLQALLRDRFKLVARRETRELPAYALTPARPGVLGPRLKRTAVDCTNAEAVAKARAGAPPGVPVCTGRPNSGRMFLAGFTMNALTQALVVIAGRQVVNATGLDGRFDIELEWGTLDNPDAPSIFTAVQEQLGLRLQPTTAPIELLVVDRIERPSEN